MINTCPEGFIYADAQQEPVVELPTPTTTTTSSTTTSTSTTTTVASSQPDNPGNSIFVTFQITLRLKLGLILIIPSEILEI